MGITACSRQLKRPIKEKPAGDRSFTRHFEENSACYDYVMKAVIGVIAVVLTFIAYIPYYRDILNGKTRPHIYSWSLWGLLTILLVALQIKGGAGPATWVTAAAGLLCIG